MTGVANVSSMMFVPLLLVVGVLLYTVEGTSSARLFIVSIVVLYALHGGIEAALTYHASHPPPGMPDMSGSDVVRYSWWTRVSSLAAIVVDFIVIIVVYQALHNALPARVPLGVPLYAALVTAMAADAAAFTLLNNSDLFQVVRNNGLNITQKLEAGFFAGAPVAVFLSWTLRRGGAHQALDRKALELLDLKKALRELEEKLREQRAQFLHIKDTFSRYVSPAVVDAIVADPGRVRLGGDVKDVSVLFADIRGYSTLAERLAPTEIIELLNRYFERVSAVILAHEGMINEFEGDGVLAVFGAPLPLPGHADHCLAAALDMLTAVDVLNAEFAKDGTLAKWQAAGFDRMRIRIGIHSGTVVAGNVGSASRIKYAVIGDTVNTAARVEALNKQLETTLLCTRATVERLDAMKARVQRDLGAYAVKGKSELVHVFTFEHGGG